MKRRTAAATAGAVLALVLGATGAPAQTRLLRYPDIHGEQLVFCYAGDLWLAPAAGGTAARLTSHPGIELFPKFSPDGRWIAFTGQYDGDEQVYVMPAAGGAPRQLTYYPARGPLAPRWGSDNQVHGWSVDGGAVLFRSMRGGWDLSDTRLYLAPLAGGLPRPLPMPVSGAGDFSPDGTRMIYSPLARDFRTWKRYQGGWAQDLYVFDLQTHDTRQVTVHPRSDRDPMWIGNTIYFASDRDGKLNLYAHDLETGETSRLTREKTWDVRWPSSDGRRRIVYELNGELRVLDVETRSARPAPIRVPDDGVSRRPSRTSAAGQIEDFELSPRGERAVFVARGDLFTAPIEKGRTRNLTRSSGAHDKWGRWSPDGSRIAFVSDRDGEEEIYLVDQDGAGQPRQLTDGGRAMRYAPEWSPDGARLAFSDKDGKVFVLEVDGGRPREIADETRGQVLDYSWAPGGKYLAFSLSDANEMRSIWIWSVQDGELRRVTGELFDERDPAWDPRGDYLYYLSDREFAPQIANSEWNYATDRQTGIYALALREDVAHPMPPQSDEVTIGEKRDDGEEGEDDEDAAAKPEARIDFAGLERRIARLEIPFDNYSGLSAAEGRVLYVRHGPFYYGRDSDVKPSLNVFTLEDRKTAVLAEDISGYAIAADGNKVLVRHPSGFKLYDVDPARKDDAKEVSTAGLQVDRVPAEEWAQIFDEVWRRYRDFFYVENMHGYDWRALGERYRPLLEHVAHRSDLNYLIGEMIAELSVSHAYVSGGDYDVPPRPVVALLGATLALDAGAGRYRIESIYRGHNEEERYRSPLTEVGVQVAEGDYLLSINGEPLTATDNPYRLLRHKAGQPVELGVSATADPKTARKVVVRPIDSEVELRYLAWVTRNREQVDRATDGRVGYLHIPDMGANGLREFIKWFYGQIRKEGLVIDVRNNGGGNVSQMLIERLRRELLGTRFSRTRDVASTYPAVVFHGHLVCVLDEDSASDGDIFPHMFRRAGLGPLIGKRSWGGVVGITNRGPLIDGGTIYVPEFGTNDLRGEYVIEGHGVDPDIIVENDPRAVIEGRDQQLERAIEEVLQRIRQEPRRLPRRPPDPVRTR